MVQLRKMGTGVLAVYQPYSFIRAYIRNGYTKEQWVIVKSPKSQWVYVLRHRYFCTLWMFKYDSFVSLNSSRSFDVEKQLIFDYLLMS
jgi:hypothetical protein